MHKTCNQIENPMQATKMTRNFRYAVADLGGGKGGANAPPFGGE